jgi:hypothetical protein
MREPFNRITPASENSTISKKHFLRDNIVRGIMLQLGIAAGRRISHDINTLCVISPLHVRKGAKRGLCLLANVCMRRTTANGLFGHG